MERPDEVTRFLRCGGMNCDRSCENGGEVEECLTWRVHGYVEQLEAQVPRWISVEERLPDKRKHVLVFKQRTDHAIYPVAMWHIEIDWRGEDGWSNNQDNGYFDVTHWMPMPKPPKEE